MRMVSVRWEKGKTMDNYDATEIAYKNGYADAMCSIVRCKNCEFCGYNSSNGTYKCRSMNGMNRTVEPNDFCSYGERRDNDG